MFEGFVCKYRKVPVVIEAIQLRRNNVANVLTFLGKHLDSWDENSETGENRIEIETLEGVMIANEGDFIIKGVAGEFYPCKEQVFKQTYEAVNDK